MATGVSDASLEPLYKVGKSIISQFVQIGCEQIAKTLKDFIGGSETIYFKYVLIFITIYFNSTNYIGMKNYVKKGKLQL